MKKNLIKPFIFLFILSTYSCTGVQDVVFPSLSDEEVVAPPALEDVPATIESAETATQEIPPSQYAQPPVAQPQVAYDTGPTGTFVGGKINQFRADLSSIQNAVSSHNNDFLRFKDLVDEQTSVYQGLSSAIRSRLQIGTTPGNPILVGQWNDAQRALEDIQNNVNNLQIVNNRVTADAALITHLKNAIDSSFFISGAIDEDHNQLKVLNDDVQRTSVLYSRLMDELEEKISREIQILNAERQYMKELSADVEVGKFGGRVSAPPTRSFQSSTSETSGEETGSIDTIKIAPLNYDNAILVIKFDDTNFDYSTALFESISNALEQMPSASFEVVAVSPTGGASFAEKARQRASEVFNKVVEMGVPSERVSLASSNSTSAQAEEVHIYLKN
ncbi:MAG: hypothetical protein CBC84_001570 [Pelagibacteraceae bacterium TMED124]|nr:hypothetical protein [Rickettsiales bacterium]RPG18407.1 MAG: hypothetical protein CBC84_001570 [Pelagibacteraceae bacterium TMED124]|tara:strand:+ start:87 stop:1253 length:1167 start_codon:yes stop_codon:yes gene_type:complete